MDKKIHRLRELRNELKMTQTEFAEAMGGEPGWYFQRVQRLEANARGKGGTRMTLEVAKEICRKLKRPLSDLIPDAVAFEAAELMEEIDQLEPHHLQIVKDLIRTLREKTSKSGRQGH